MSGAEYFTTVLAGFILAAVCACGLFQLCSLVRKAWKEWRLMRDVKRFMREIGEGW
jgi:membrane-associated phospholipid phosphatase